MLYGRFYMLQEKKARGICLPKSEKGKNYPGIDLERALAYQDLDKAIITCLDNQVKNLTLKQKNINKLALLTKEFLEETNKQF